MNKAIQLILIALVALVIVSNDGHASNDMPYPEANPIVVITLPDSPYRVNGDDGKTVDVLAAYTQAGEVTREEIDTAITETNNAYDNSEIDIRLNLVGMVQVDYIESDMYTDIERLRDTEDGYMDNIHVMRDLLAADVVVLFVGELEYDGIRYCGLSHLMSVLGHDFESYAFNLVSRRCLYTDYVVAHEIGHNMGLTHDRRMTPEDGLPFPYAYGYFFDAIRPDSFRTIMAYKCLGLCLRIPNFSNPDVLHNGIPTGIDHEADPENSADAARAISGSALVVANWRDSTDKTGRIRAFLPILTGRPHE